ncbi:MAG: hypothetical protein M1455_05265 [Actinobacteria bacterium]|nr:hypothetical protein [Actinomycetota bacterium]
MVERIMTVDVEDLDWRNRDVYLDYMYDLDRKMFDLPEGGSLFLNLARVKHMDNEYAYKSVAALQCIQGEGPLKSKHLVIVQPYENILKKIEYAVDINDEAFMYIKSENTEDHGECNVLRFKGKVINATYKKVLTKLLEEEKLFAASDLIKVFNKGSLQLYADALKELYGWGIICKFEESGKPGRPVSKYSAYWPETKSFWPLPSKPIIWDVDGRRFARPTKAKKLSAA